MVEQELSSPPADLRLCDGHGSGIGAPRTPLIPASGLKAEPAGVAAEQVRMAAVGAAAVITLLGAAFFGTTIFLLSGAAARRAFEPAP